jgi:hypothetical protein
MTKYGIVTWRLQQRSPQMAHGTVSVWIAQLVKSLASSCVLAHAYPYRWTAVQLPSQTRSTKPSILSGSVTLVAVFVQWVTSIEDYSLRYRGTLNGSVCHNRKLPRPVMSAAITRSSTSSQSSRRAAITKFLTKQCTMLHAPHCTHLRCWLVLG